jgi:hypothetical protein
MHASPLPAPIPAVAGQPQGDVTPLGGEGRPADPPPHEFRVRTRRIDCGCDEPDVG